jgi:tryprostatin B 6-hydroxylase
MRRRYKNLYALHEQYGEYVRTGPSELSIVDPESILAIHGTSSGCNRAAWYGMADPIKAIFHTRDDFEHDQRRPVWEQGFSVSALKAYEPKLKKYVVRILNQINDRIASEEPVNVSLWLNYLTFDIMEDIAFGKGYGLLERGEKLDALKKLEDG